MKMIYKRLLVVVTAILLAAIIITFQQNNAKNTNQSIERYIQPLIDMHLNAIVVNKSIVNIPDRIQSSNAMVYSLKIDCTDILTGEVKNFRINYRYQNSIENGDSIMKDKGGRTLFLHKKEGSLIQIPIE